MKKVGINGFGRIGRLVLRAWLQDPNSGIEIVAVNNPLRKGETMQHFLHLLEFDSVHRRLSETVEEVPGGFRIGAREIKFYTEMSPANIPWGATGVEVVVDATGVFKDQAGLGQHLHSGVKKVVMTAPGEALDATLVFGVNEHTYDAQKHRIVSNASCTTNCLAPVLKVLDDHLGVVRGALNTVHSYTADQCLIDAGHSDLRRARAAALNMIPTKTGAATAIGEVLPHLQGKLHGYAIRVPTPDVSLIDLCVEVKKSTSKAEVNELFKQAAQGSLHGILQLSEKELVSSDFIGDRHSASVDAKYTAVIEGTMVKVVAWYDNEFGYSCRVLDLVKLL